MKTKVIAAAVGMTGLLGLAAAPVSASNSTTVRGDWVGRYTCSQGLTGLNLKVQGLGHAGSLRATFRFYPLPRNPGVPKGEFIMTGRYYSAARIVLRPRRWVHKPPGYEMVGLSGKLTRGTFHGKINHPACTTFSLRKQRKS
jgi:hypothetical protein